MFEKLRNVNIEARSDAELIALRRQTLYAYNLYLQATQELVLRYDNNENETIIPAEPHAPTTISKGRKLSQKELSNINEKDSIIPVP